MNSTAPYDDAPMEYVGRVLDARGVTLVTFIDPVDGSKVPGITWQDMRKVLNHEHDHLVAVAEVRPIEILVDPEITVTTSTVTTPTWHQANRREILEWLAAGALGLLLLEGVAALAWWLLVGGGA